MRTSETTDSFHERVFVVALVEISFVTVNENHVTDVVIGIGLIVIITAEYGRIGADFVAGRFCFSLFYRE